MKTAIALNAKVKKNRKLTLSLLKYTNQRFWKSLILKLLMTCLFIGLAYVLIYPLLYIFATSIKSYDDMLDPTSIWIAKKPVFTTYVDAFKALDFIGGLKNSTVIALGATVLQLMSCSIIGYGFARFKFKERNAIFALVILTLLVPPQTIIVPQFIFYKNFDILGIIHGISGSGINLLDTYVPFLLPAVFGLGLKSGLFIYIFRQFYRGMPKELEEAAYIDGCGAFATYFRVMFPNAVPAITSVALFSFVWHWNDVFEPSMYLQDFSKYTLGMKLVGIVGIITKGAKVTDLTYIIPTKYAGIALVLLPMFFLYLFGQRYFIESVERSGIVG